MIKIKYKNVMYIHNKPNPNCCKELKSEQQSLQYRTLPWTNTPFPPHALHLLELTTNTLVITVMVDYITQVKKYQFHQFTI